MTYQTASLIEAVSDPAFGRLIVAWQCKPHDCPNNAAVLLRLTGGGCRRVFRDRRRQRVGVERPRVEQQVFG
jgi:hypothetical protein